VIADRVRLPLSFDATALRRDVEAIADAEWVPHFNTGIYEGDWSGVSLRSVGGKADTIYPDPAATDPYADTALRARCPALSAVLDRLDCELLAVRLLRLGPGAAIGEHRDYRLGYDDGEIRLHVPIVTNDAVAFVLAGEPVDMKPGETWYLDFNQPHAVANHGSEPRIHLVIDCVVNGWLSRQLGAG
jgi:hypothetical protein